MGFDKKFKRDRSRANIQRAIDHARAHRADIITGEMTDELREKLVQLVQTPKYRAQIDVFATACQQWRRYNPDVVLEWQDTAHVLVSGDPGVAHVRQYLAKNDAAANLIEYADEVTGRAVSLMQIQFALVGLGWLK